MPYLGMCGSEYAVFAVDVAVQEIDVTSFVFFLELFDELVRVKLRWQQIDDLGRDVNIHGVWMIWVPVSSLIQAMFYFLDAESVELVSLVLHTGIAKHLRQIRTEKQWPHAAVYTHIACSGAACVYIRTE